MDYTLFDYLGESLPVIENLRPLSQRPSIYAEYDIQGLFIRRYPGFTLHAILNRYGDLLMNVTIDRPRPPTARQQYVMSESGVEERISELISPLLRRALEVAFNVMPQLVKIIEDVGKWARLQTGRRQTEASLSWPLYRGPGEAKPRWNFRSIWAYGLMPDLRQAYNAVVQQLYSYMTQHEATYGWLLTDQELIIAKVDPATPNTIYLPEAIPWTAGGTRAAPQLTVLLALWTLGMKISEDLSPPGTLAAWQAALERRQRLVRRI